MRFRSFVCLALGALAGVPVGCGPGADALPVEPDLYPVTGKVTVQGEPLSQAVVTFLQVDEKGTTAIGETDEEGNYILSHVGRPGVGPGDYTVAISYLEGTDGTIYGAGPRSGLSKPYGMFSAKERIVPEWSDLGQATTKRTVREGGGVFDFDLPPLLPPPEPGEGEAGAEGEAPAPADEAPITSNPNPNAPPAEGQAP